MAKISSSSSVFAKAGNPWVTEREGREKFGRILETENPDFDAFARATKIKSRVPYVDPPDNRRQGEGDLATKFANIGIKMNRVIHGKGRK